MSITSQTHSTSSTNSIINKYMYTDYQYTPVYKHLFTLVTYILRPLTQTKLTSFSLKRK